MAFGIHHHSSKEVKMSKFRKRILFAIASIAVSIVGFDFAAQAQGTGSCLGSTSKPAISAIYLDNYAGLHSIGKKVWLQSVGDSQLVFHLCSVDDTKHYLIVRNDDANDFNPGKFSRFEWYGQDGLLFYCQQVFDAASAAEAEDFTKTPAADTSDASRFPWSELILIRR
jgi:hypothetical protein